MERLDKLSTRAWVTKEYGIENNTHILRRASRIAKRLGIGEPVGGRTGTLLTPDEWSQIKIAMYGTGD